MIKHEDLFIWADAYRPQKIKDCVLPMRLSSIFQQFVVDGNMPHLLFYGQSGIGKTTIARALCEEMGLDYIFINGSEDSGIDVLRTVIRDFASTVSLQGGVKVVIIDEADYLNAASTQPALRGFMEEFSKNCRFIFTCNNKNKIIPALHSRTTSIHFQLLKEEKLQIAGKFFKRVCEILDQESVVYDKKALAEFIKKHFPDFRKTLNELQLFFRKNGEVDIGILPSDSDLNMKNLLDHLKSKNFTKIREWVVENIDNDYNQIYKNLYEYLSEKTENKSELVLIVAEYSYKSSFAIDSEINLTACLVEIMTSCQFK